jgi:transcriptional regulator with XRE-family HTH domain
MGHAEPALPALAAALARCDDLDALARAVRVEVPSLDRFVRGTAVPSPPVRARLSAALGVPEPELFRHAEWLRRALRGRRAAASIGVEAAALAAASRHG